MRGTFYGGFYTESDFTGDIHKFTTGLAEAYRRRGAVMRLGTDVVSATADADRVTLIIRSTEPTLDDRPQPDEVMTFDTVVVCGGVLSRKLGRALGDRINVYPVKGYSMTVSLPEPVD